MASASAAAVSSTVAGMPLPQLAAHADVGPGERLAHVARGQHLPEEAAELHEHRLVPAVLLPQLGNLLCIGMLAEAGQEWIAGKGPHGNKDECDRDDDRRQGVRDAAGEVADHGARDSWGILDSSNRAFRRRTSPVGWSL